MGEIADALKKANAERNRAREAAPRPAHRDAHADDHAESVAQGWPEDEAADREAPTRSDPREPRADARDVRARERDEAPEPARRRTRIADRLPRIEPEIDASEDDLPRVELDGELPHVDHTRHLALRLKTEMERRGARSVLIASALRNEGKTTVSCNVAIALASVSSGRGIALVDLDLRNPSVCRRLNITAERGIDEVLLGKARLDEACHSMRGPRLDVYPASKPRPNAHELLVGDTFKALLDDLHARYELVVIDSPPTLLVPDATLILRHAEACLTVAHSGITRVRMFKKMLSTLPGERVIGKVLNAAPAEKHQRDYYAYGYGADEGAEAARKGEAS